MKDLFEFHGYKDLVNYIVTLKGRGEYKRIAEYLNVSTVLISQVFKGPKDISLEQSVKICEYYAFKDLETKYFLALVSFSRAGSFNLRAFYKKELIQLKEESQKIEKRVKHNKTLSIEDQAYFYSDWTYSAIRLSCDLPEVRSFKDISKKLGLKEEKVKSVLDFLISRNLVMRSSDGLSLGVKSTHLSKDSIYIKSHHLNWRNRSLNTFSNITDSETMYSAPFSMSKSNFEKLNSKILKLVENFVELATEEQAEDLYYLNIDLRKMK